MLLDSKLIQLKYKSKLEKTKKFAGIGGTFNYSPQDHAGLTRDAFVLVQIKQGDWKLIK